MSVRTSDSCNTQTRFTILWIRLLLCIFACVLAGCGGNDLGDYTGQWYSSLNDTDEYGRDVTLAYRLTVRSDSTYTMSYCWAGENEWKQHGSGKTILKKVNVDGAMRDGTQLGADYGVLSSGGMNIQVGGKLRAFKRSGIGFFQVCTMIILAITLGIIALGTYRDRQQRRNDGVTRLFGR